LCFFLIVAIREGFKRPDAPISKRIAAVKVAPNAVSTIEK